MTPLSRRATGNGRDALARLDSGPCVLAEAKGHCSRGISRRLRGVTHPAVGLCGRWTWGRTVYGSAACPAGPYPQPHQ